MSENHNQTDDQTINISDMNEQIQIRLQKLKDLQKEGADPFEIVTYEQTAHAKDIIDHFDEMEGNTVQIAGRIMSQRGMGKVSFCDIHDKSGKIQVFTKIDMLGEEAYQKWKSLDIGDLVGVEGIVMRSQRGEITIKSKGFVLLAKALRPLPEKFHGLTDTDTRYRQRYVDLIVNEDVKHTFQKRSMIIRTIREYLDHHGFLEVETPILNVIAGGAAAKPFTTKHNALKIDLFMRIAPELYLKRLIVGGLERVYEIGRNFRNEGIDSTHNPEFTMVEVYQAYTDFNGMMELAEMLISTCAMKVNQSTKATWDGVELDLTPPFNRLTMTEAIKMYAGVDFDQIHSDEEAKLLAKERGLEIEESWKRGDYMALFFDEYVEDKLIQPTFIYDYPIEISPLSKRKPTNKQLAERFELFICGKEFANAYSELNDPVDQRQRFADQLKKREAGDEEASSLDEDFCKALEYGMPPTGGLGIGIDRLCMMLTNSTTIRDVLLFPTMKPLKD